jgi:Cu-processing system ATP-binding protein
VIAFREFGKRYGEHRGVESLTLTIGRGEAVALLGPNGSGKTTSLKAAAGLLRPTSGAVLLNDPACAAWDPRARRALSFLPQRVSFPEALTGRETLDFYRALRGSLPAAVTGAKGRPFSSPPTSSETSSASRTGSRCSSRAGSWRASTRASSRTASRTGA